MLNGFMKVVNLIARNEPKGYLALMGPVVVRGSLSPFSLTAITLKSYSSPGSKLRAVASVSSGPILPGTFCHLLDPFGFFSST